MKYVAMFTAALTEVSFVFMFLATMLALISSHDVTSKMLAVTGILWVLNVGMVPQLKRVWPKELRKAPTPYRRRQRRNAR